MVKCCAASVSQHFKCIATMPQHSKSFVMLEFYVLYCPFVKKCLLYFLKE